MEPRVITYLTYEEVFGQEKLGRLEEILTSQSSIDLLCEYAFFNMVMQTTGLEESHSLEKMGIVSLFGKTAGSQFTQDQIVITREGIHHLMGKILSNVPRSDSEVNDRQKLFETLLLANSELGRFQENSYDLYRGFIRGMNSRNPKWEENYFKHNFLRYNHVYSQLVEELNATDKAYWAEILLTFEQTTGVSLAAYMVSIKNLVSWFLITRSNPVPNVSGFVIDDIRTFYIEKKNFEVSSEFLSTIQILAKTIEDFNTLTKEAKPYEIDNTFLKFTPDLFNYPVLEFSSGVYCILDLHFFAENACGGLLFKLFELNRTRLSNNMQQYKGVYGNLMELYFAELLKKMFDEVQVAINQEGSPDALLEVEIEGKRYILVFEFCTKYYKIPSLLNASLESFENDVNDIFFNNQRDGKFLKLDKYCKEVKANADKNVQVIPILVTERYIGDFDLINQNNEFLDKGIANYNLENLKESKPVILCLNDLECFWAGSEQTMEAQQFVNELIVWRSVDKGPYLFMFPNFFFRNTRIMSNNNYLKMFNIKNLFRSS